MTDGIAFNLHIYSGNDLMSKKVLILSGSPRRGGNSDTLCDSFAKGSIESGNETEKIFIRDKKIEYCIGCYHCTQHNGKCVFEDDMNSLLDKILEADVVVLSSPVYFYSIDAQLKTVIDRCVARWTEITNKEFYFIMTAAEDSDTVMDGTIACMNGFVSCCSGSEVKGMILGKGLYDYGEATESKYLQEAYDMGRSI